MEIPHYPTTEIKEQKKISKIQQATHSLQSTTSFY